ncbi:MAG: hypothetical protein ACREN4_03775 [Candidatus Dormibacteria bacterium]
MAALGRLRRRPSWDWAAPTSVHLALAALAIALTLALIGSFTLDGWQRALSGWDSHWYLLLGRQGYPARLGPQWAYFPLYPALIAALVHLGAPALWAALLLSLAGTAALVICLGRLAEIELGPELRSWPAWLLLLSPFGFFFSAAYTEALFFALVAGCMLCARRGRFGWAGVLGALAAATRVTGLFLLLGVLLEALQQAGWDPRRLNPRAGLAALVPLGTVAYGAYSQLRLGDWLAFSRAESLYFGLRLAWPWQGLATTWGAATGSSAYLRGAFTPEVVAGLLGVPILALAIWRLRPLYWSFMLLSWLAAVSLTFWRSVPRYELAFFPALLLLVELSRHARWLRWAWVVAGGGAMAYGASVFARGLWLN